MTDTTTETLPFAAEPHTIEELRLWGDLLCLWRLCAKPACRRARACRGDARRCFPREFHLLPEAVRTWYAELAEMQQEGLSFDDAMLELDATECGTAFRDWHAAVSQSLGENDTLPESWWEAKP